MIVTTSPLVTAYLADLDRALAGADPADRLEIVDAVREHIDAAVGDLGASPSQAEIAGVLRRLGTADDVAAAWAAGADRPLFTAPARPGAVAGYGPAQPGAGAAYGPAQPGQPPHPAQPGYPPYPAPRTSGLPGWAIALIVVGGLLLVGPLVAGLAVPLLLMRTGGPVAVGGGAWLTPLVLLAATVAAGIAWRRSADHRTGWKVAFIVLAVLSVMTLTVGAGLAL